MQCGRCGAHLTRPSPLSERTNTCKECRKQLKREENERMKLISIQAENEEPTYEREEYVKTSETIIQEPPEKMTGKLAEIKLEKRTEGIYMFFHSPIIQNFMLNTISQGFGFESTSNMKPADSKQTYYQYTYGWKPDFQNQYKSIVTQNPCNPLINEKGIINIGFFYIANKDNTVDAYGTKIQALPEQERIRKLLDPEKPIEYIFTGVQTNDQLDEYVAKLKEVIYKIYIDNMATYNKRIIINFTEEPNEKQSSQNTENPSD